MQTPERTLLLPLLLAVLGGALSAEMRGDALQLRPAETICAGAAPLDVGDHAIPCVTDWNGDGRKDLLAGYQTAGKIALFLNAGTDARPEFTKSVNLQAGGVDIQHTSGGCGAPAPWVCDYDGDGRRDLLVGAGADGQVYFYRNTNTGAAPLLAPGIRLQAGGSTLTVGLRATPYVHDWDEDGLPDLFCGSGDGSVYWFRNTATAGSPVYAPSVRLEAGGTILNLGARSVVRVFDWDGDGHKDLIGSSSTGVYWCRNTGSNTAPRLEAPVALRAPVAGGGLAAIYTGYRMRLELVDWNNDGVIDLLLGNADGTVYWYAGYHFAFTGISARAGSQVVMEWTSAPFLEYDVLAGPSCTAVEDVVATGLPSNGVTSACTNKPGTGQQFYRLRIAD